MKVEAYPSSRFYVEVDQEPWGVFTEVTGLQVEVSTIDVEEGGHNSHPHRLPGRAKVGNITLKRGMVSSNKFFKWCMKVAGGKIERRHVSVVLYSVSGEEVLRWNFIGAYPVKWMGPQFNGTQSSALVESIELAHKGLGQGSKQGKV